MAVYTPLPPDTLHRFLADYALGNAHACKGIAEGVENSNFLLETGSGRYILTIYEKRVRRDDLPFFLGLLEHLAARGVPCPLPVRRTDGELMGEIAGKPASIVTFLPGKWVRAPRNAHLSALGEATAALHLAGRGFPLSRANDLSLAGWQRLAAIVGDDAERIQPGLSGILRAEVAEAEAHFPAALPGGVIHADLFPDNVFYQGERLSGLIDFYFACTDAYAYDLAIILNAWCFERAGEFNITKARHLLEGYHRVRPLSDAELDALPRLARNAALRFLLTRTHDWLHRVEGALVTPKDPLEYLHKLRFHQRVTHHREYGL